MNSIIQNAIGSLKVRARPEAQAVITAIDALRESENFLRLDDPANCLACLNTAEAALAKVETVDAAAEETFPALSEPAALLEKTRMLTTACRKALRESADQEQLRAVDKYVIVACAACVAIISIAAGIPYLLSGGKISSVRTQVYWVHYPRGLAESFSGYAPMSLDGEWHEIRVKASDPMTAVRIDPATDSTVLDFYDVRNARVLWQNPDIGFDSELEQVYWRGDGCVASNADGYLNITEMEPDCNVTSMNFPAYYEVSEIIFEARGESRRLGVWKWLAWTLGWRSINE